MDGTGIETVIQNEDNFAENSSETELIDEVIEKHEKNRASREKPLDIIITQITICIIILLIVAAANIIRSGFAEIFVDNFREMTCDKPEELIKDAVDEAVRLVWAVH